MEELFKFLGLSAAFTAGAAVYGLFRFLDVKASPEANRVVTAWLRGEQFKRLDLQSAVASSFDHLYGVPLLSFRTFLRSACLSIVVSVIYYTMFLNYHHDWQWWMKWEINYIMYFLPSVIITDYISLFFVIKLLKSVYTNKFILIFFAFIFAVIALAIANIIASFFSGVYSRVDIFNLELALAYIFIALLPVLLVHLWLPLYWIGAGLNHAFVPFFKAVGLAQWFIKQGDEHPLDAIGLTASLFVFTAAALFQGIAHFL